MLLNTLFASYATATRHLNRHLNRLGILSFQQYRICRRHFSENADPAKPPKADANPRPPRSMNWTVQALSSVSSDTEPTIVVTADSAKYIFNVGENTSRAFVQSRKGWRRTRALFMSQICTDRAAGLPGFLMTLADGGFSTVQVIGPEGLAHFIASARRYTFRHNMSLAVKEIPTGLAEGETSTVYQDENVTVQALMVTPQVISIPTPRSPTQIPIPGAGSSNQKRKRSPSQSSSPPSKRAPLPPPLPAVKGYHTVPSLQSPTSLLHTSQEIAQQLLDRLKAPRFSTSAMTEAEATVWRNLTIEHMFGAKALETESTQENTSQQQQGRKPRKGLNPATCQQQLPTWSPRYRPTNISLPSGSPPTRTDNQLRSASSFIIAGPKVRGKFDATKANALGVPNGPLRGKLTKGQSVTVKITSPEGVETERVVHPEDCMLPAEKAMAFCIIDCPTPDYIDGLIGSDVWNAYRGEAIETTDHLLRAVIHIVGDGVVEDPRYVQWMSTFGEDVHHLVANKQYCTDRVTFTSAAYNRLCLNQLDAEMFPLPHREVDPKHKLEELASLPNKTEPLQAYHMIGMRPWKAPHLDPFDSESDLFHPAVSASSGVSLPANTLEKFREAQEAVQKASHPVQPFEDITIIPLGTGSATPSKYRNVSSTLIQIPNRGNILLDSGEGTLGQLARHFGPELEHVLRDLRCIFISHVHADHHIGLSRVLVARRKLNPPNPLDIIADRAVQLYLKEYSNLEDLGLNDNVKLIESDTLDWKAPAPQDNQASGPGSGFVRSGFVQGLAMQGLLRDLRLSSIQTVDVAHRMRCRGVVLKHQSGWCIVFSGDTMPTDNLVRAGEGCTLLIHEATMADEEAHLAHLRGHSTVGQAIDISTKMKAQNLLLTHFSARYPKMPPQTEDTANCHVGLALDHARFSLQNFWKADLYQSAIAENFKDLGEEVEE